MHTKKQIKTKFIKSKKQNIKFKTTIKKQILNLFFDFYIYKINIKFLKIC